VGIVKLSLATLQLLIDRSGNGWGCQGLSFHWCTWLTVGRELLNQLIEKETH